MYTIQVIQKSKKKVYENKLMFKDYQKKECN